MIALGARRVPERRWVQDGMVAVGYLGIGLLLQWIVPEVRINWGPPGPEPSIWVSAGALALACLGQTQRRTRPLLALAFGVLAVLCGPLLTGTTALGILLVFADQLYCAVLYTPHRASWVVSGAAAVAVVGAAGFSLVHEGGRAALLNLLSLWLILVVPVLWAAEVRRHREQAEAERARAEAAQRMAELDRAAAVAAERARMARDLHDVIAGQLSAIALQSEAALSLAGADPATMRRVLTSVRENSVASLAEMRTMIGLLRADGATEPRTAPGRLDQLAPLLDSARASGLRVELVDERPVGQAAAAGVELAAYRIVQEALTNAAKHSPGGAVRLHLRHDDGRLVIEVTNELTAGSGGAGGTGTGLLGLRERAQAVGGSLAAGREAEVWRLRAELPVDAPGSAVARPAGGNQ
ncbi:sensor histidine kinase [Pseudonocardia hispaniensis]|uniref:histidine kinase n=1 Tax=Pseudonocardia hispaniensis TaxID=904933 RepID=A0ABW1J4Y2_9PSEU